MPAVPSQLRELVRQRAADHCEYCRISQHASDFYRLQVEHVVARQHGGPTHESNLALACQHCNLHKGPNAAGFDPDTGALCPLFNPRAQRWDDHFARAGLLILGRTPVGRTTVRVLAMNSQDQLDVRVVDA
jgi:hypothetical protein